MALSRALNDLRVSAPPSNGFNRRPGIKIQPGESVDAWTKRAGLAWEAKKTPCLFDDGEGVASCDRNAVIYRSDTRAPLGVVGKNFKIFQPRDVVNFYDDLVKRHGFTLTEAGCFKGGKIVWAKAETGDVMRVHGNDVLQGYVLLSTSFDGSLATTARFSTLRIVCMNGLTVGEDIAPVVRISHRSVFDADAAKIKLGVGDAFVRFQEQANAMASKHVDTRQAIEFFLEVYHSMKSEQIVNAQAEKTTDKTIERLAQHFLASPGAEMASAKGTVWGLLNAVTYDIDHARRARSDENRDTSAMFGDGERIKNKARELALSMVA